MTAKTERIQNSDETCTESYTKRLDRLHNSSKNDDWSLEVYGLHKRENSGLFFRRLDT